MMNYAVRKNILIICEGENTENNFFGSIRDCFINRNYSVDYDSITIRPEPRLESVPKKVSKSKAKDTRPKRSIRGSEESEPSYPLPLKWVKEAQRELESGTFEEVWVVYDHDDHPALQKAWEAAHEEINGKSVNVAFSSRCFEFFLLIHFEKKYYPFSTSECKGKDKKPIICGPLNPEGNCNGSKCVNGYMREKGYLPPDNTTKKGRFSTFKLVEDKLEVGFQNSAWIRFMSDMRNGQTPIYLRNPYITTDNLVKRLIGNTVEYIWICSGEIELGKHVFLQVNNPTKIVIVENKKMTLHVSEIELNNKNIRINIEPNNAEELLCVDDKVNELIWNNNKIIFIDFTKQC